MGWLRGFEPPASWTTTRRSNQLSYSHHHLKAATAEKTWRRICVAICTGTVKRQAQQTWITKT